MQLLSPQRVLSLDIEGRGFHDTDRFSICQIALVELVDGVMTGVTRQWSLNPKAKISPYASEIHGLTNAKLEGYPTFTETAQEIVDFIGSSILIAHGASGDAKMLNNDLRLAGLPEIPKSRFLCVAALAKLAHESHPDILRNSRKNSYGVAELCAHLGVPYSRTLHNALADATFTARCFTALCALKIPTKVRRQAFLQD